MLEGLLGAKKLDKSGAQELSLNITCPLKWISHLPLFFNAKTTSLGHSGH